MNQLLAMVKLPMFNLKTMRIYWEINESYVYFIDSILLILVIPFKIKGTFKNE